jgi:hypothetical protein
MPQRVRRVGHERDGQEHADEVDAAKLVVA